MSAPQPYKSQSPTPRGSKGDKGDKGSPGNGIDRKLAARIHDDITAGRVTAETAVTTLLAALCGRDEAVYASEQDN